MQGASTRAAWKARFFTIWAGQACSLFGSGIAQFALVWWITETTGSATVLALATLVAVLPGVIIGPFAGALIDRWNRRLVMIASDTLSAGAAAALVLLFWSGAIDVWHVYLVMFVRSLAGTFQWPAMQASTSLMVPRAHLARVAGLNQMLHGAQSVAAPPISALLLSVLPLHAIMGIDVLTALLAVVPLLFVNVPQPSTSTVTSGTITVALLKDVGAGMRYIWNWPGLLIVLLMATVINLLVTPAFSLQPILVTRHFGGTAIELSWMESAWGIGMIVGGLLLGVWGGFKRRIITTLTGAIGMGLGIMVIGLAPASGLGIAIAAIFFAGLMNPIVNGPIFAIMQDVVAPDMQGRVFTVLGSLSGAMAPLGLAIAGPVADAVGVQVWYMVGGAACILLAITGLFLPPVLRLEEQRHAADPSDEAQAFGDQLPNQV